MKKTVLFILFLITISFAETHAENYFDINLESTYEFNERGGCDINDRFEIINKYTERYMPSFEYSIKNTEISDIKVEYNGKYIEPITQHDDASSNIKINFDDKILGKGNKRTFLISYKIENLASKTGDVWELSIPKNENINDYNKFNTVLIVPEVFGREAYITPNYSEKTTQDAKLKYLFNKEKLLDSRIVVGFGDYQIFNFLINFRLKNERSITDYKTISIPPDTSYQRMFYNSIDPKPINIDVDNDGNWLAKYRILPNSQVNIKISGNVQVFANPRKYLTPPIQNLYENIKPTQYWQADDTAIVNLAKSLGNPKELYDHVTNSLFYDFSLSKKDRLGAVHTLTSRENSSCREYTDLLIALYRAKGIPAREIIGYAYSDNPDLKPISFYNDVLHSWVEYWDFEKKIWVSVDPTWGATSKSDYFSKFDLRHFAFTIHGIDDSKPIPPGFYNPDGLEKDIFINFGTLENTPEKSLEVKNLKNNFYVLNRNNIITVKNTNNYALYDKNIKYYYDDSLIYEDNIKIIPPYSGITKRLSTRYSILAVSTPSTITIAINNKLIKFKGPKYPDLYSQLIVIFALIIFFTSIVIFKHKNSRENV